MASAVRGKCVRARAGESGNAIGGDDKRVLGMAGVEPVCGGSHAGSAARILERRAGDLWSGCTPAEARMDDPPGEEPGGEMRFYEDQHHHRKAQRIRRMAQAFFLTKSHR